jgi:peptidoglycan LD-endopeptidase CwlK
MLFVVLLFFVLSIAIAGLVFFPALRAMALNSVRALVDRVGERVSGAAKELAETGSSTGNAAADGLLRSARVVKRHKWLLSSSLVLVVAVPSLALWLRLSHRADSFDPTVSREVDEHVAMLLQGEQLVPPPPLPPELFMTPEVTQVRPMVQGASRQWELLDAEFKQRLLLVFKLMAEQNGYQMVLIEGYRSPERQATLAAMGSSVTLAGAGASYHQYGLAADCAFLRNGKIAISEKDPWVARGYELYGEVSASLGLTWGGAWRSIKDYGHVELRRPGVLKVKSRQSPVETGGTQVE